jgi:inosine-uridine nucleoside N-ribohydrolase
MTRRAFLGTTVAAAGVVAGARRATADCPRVGDTFGLLGRGRKIPVIFDTDIGGDIDDTWALCMLLRCPEVDVRLVVSDSGNATYRARILAKMLEVYERADIPVAVGIPPGDEPDNQSDWIEGYALSDYPGIVHEDGVAAIIDTINASADPVTLVCIGAVPNIAAALKRDPGIVNNARFVGMHGSVRRGYGDGSAPAPEANVRTDPAALRAVFAAPWECTVTPLDTCDRVHLTGEKYQQVYRCEKPGPRALIENYRVWKPGWLNGPPPVETRSTTLFDTVAVYLAFSEDLLQMESLPLAVTDDGFTVVDETQRPIRCATDWKDLAAFEDLLVERLIS